MTLSSNDAVRNKVADARVDALDLGVGNATMKLYTGSKPADPDTAASGTLLATITLNKPAFGAASSGAAAMDVTGLTASAVADGTVGWARLASSDDVYREDVTQGTDFTVSDTTLETSQSVTVTSFTITEP